MPVDLPERPDAGRDADEEDKFVIAAPVLGWLIDVGASLIVAQLLLSFEVTQPVVQLAAALFLTFVGGYSAGFIAGYREVEHAFVMGLMSFATTIVLASRYPQTGLPEWYDPVAFVMTIPMAVLGGLLRMKAKPRAR